MVCRLLVVMHFTHWIVQHLSCSSVAHCFLQLNGKALSYVGLNIDELCVSETLSQVSLENIWDS